MRHTHAALAVLLGILPVVYYTHVYMLQSDVVNRIGDDSQAFVIHDGMPKSSDREWTAVEKHVALFFRPHGRMDRAYLEAVHHRMGIYGMRITAKALVIGALAVNASELVRVENPARSRIWNADGTVSEERWSELVRQMNRVDVARRRYVLRSDFASLVGASNPWAFAACPVTWNRVTAASFDELVEFFGDTCICTSRGVELGLELETLRAFYDDSRPFFVRRMAGWRPPVCDAVLVGLACMTALSM